MTSYLARLFYLGTDYYGSQLQPGLRTVQAELIKAVSLWSGESHSSKTIQLAGRTDRGVHSIGQLVKITTSVKLDLEAVNKFLPDDMTLWAFCKIDDTVNLRHAVLMRHYRYFLEADAELDLDAMRDASRVLTGTHDFSYLSKPDSGRPSVTTMLNISICRTDDIVILDMFGTSFLWNLVRKIVTLLRLVGLHTISPVEVYDMLSQPRLVRSGIRPAPPESLVLVEAVAPFVLQPHKYALRRIARTLRSRHAFHMRQTQTLGGISALFGFPSEFC